MNIVEELQWRGLVADCTDTPGLVKRVASGPLTVYAGFDPSADSLHIGNLVPLLALRRFQLLGHHPIPLAGGATGSIGDPSGKTQERQFSRPKHSRPISPGSKNNSGACSISIPPSTPPA